ncbi:MAG: HEAT repeat domain-containing protein [Planctomycetota bacterium]|jgi:hypothetical protein
MARAKIEATRNKIGGLIRLLGDKQPSVRNSAVEALEQTGTPAVTALINALEDGNWVIRQRSAETLGRISDPKAVEPLIATLADGNMWVRLRSVEALGKLCDGRSVGPLIDALSDKNELVRRNAAEALGLIGDKKAVDALEITLNKPGCPHSCRRGVRINQKQSRPAGKNSGIKCQLNNSNTPRCENIHRGGNRRLFTAGRTHNGVIQTPKEVFSPDRRFSLTVIRTTNRICLELPLRQYSTPCAHNLCLPDR